MLGEERRQQILGRVGALLAEVDSEVELLDVILDSTRQQLAFVMQKGDRPLVVGLDWVAYASHRDDEVKALLESGLRERQQQVQQRSP